MAGARMREETPERERPLRTGITTGACATAAAVGAVELLLGGTAPATVWLELPKGQRVELALADHRRLDDAAEAAVIKDAGDDPDATHGARIWVRVRARDDPGVAFGAGDGVGVITRDGLPVAVGEPAINPVPRRMIAEHLAEAGERHGHPGGFEVIVGADDGAAMAERTMNPRLGIVGGISILGTTGIVRPFSCSAYIASIHQGIDVARANGIEHIAACTGATSERTAVAHYGLPDMALVEIGDFVGALLKYLRRHPVPAVTLVGGFGKLGKLAAGHLDTHSRKAAVDFERLAAEAAAAGAGADLRAAVRAANTSLQALAACRDAGIALGDRVAARAHAVARGYLPATVTLEVWAVDRAGTIVGRAGAL